jgi:hypothetical protein
MLHGCALEERMYGMGSLPTNIDVPLIMSVGQNQGRSQK